MQQVPIKSRLISSVAYNADSQTLHVWLHDKRHVTHYDVSEAVYNNLVSAESAGFYYTYFVARKDAPSRRNSARTVSRLIVACAISMLLVSISATSIAALS